jgi:leucyl-tRNA synthetase
VLAPEHNFVKKVMAQEIVPKEGTSHWQAVQHYVQRALAKSDMERQEEGRLKTGVFTGFYVENSLNGKRLPIWVSDFVLAGFGTGAVVGVPGHDLRDFQFAKQFDLPIIRVVVGGDGDIAEITNEKQVQEKSGKMINSGELNGLDIHEATEKMKDIMEKAGMGKRVVSYSIRDWLISRQRYWGAPIPIIHCPKDGVVAVPDDQLPVVLPEVKSYEPSGNGRSPLANIPEFVNTTCPTCGGPAERETDTMDGFACSSWYFLRFADPHNDQAPFARDKADFWLPVDDYIGGAEHAVMHLLYARFWTKVMFDNGLINFEEPFTTLRNHGMILAPNGQKMSKSKGNTIEPDEIIGQGYGADSIRIMELFIGPWNQTANWSVEGMGGAFRFLQRVWTVTQESLDTAKQGGIEQNYEQAILKATHKTIKTVSRDLENLGFNTAIATLMEYVNELYKLKEQDHFASKAAWDFAITSLLKLVAPFAPHLAEELWEQSGHDTSIHTSEWPVYDEKFLIEDTVTVVIQVNGKLRGEISVPSDASEETVVEAAKSSPRAAAYLNKQTIKKTIYIPERLINFVI